MRVADWWRLVRGMGITIEGSTHKSFNRDSYLAHVDGLDRDLGFNSLISLPYDLFDQCSDIKSMYVSGR